VDRRRSSGDCCGPEGTKPSCWVPSSEDDEEAATTTNGRRSIGIGVDIDVVACHRRGGEGRARSSGTALLAVDARQERGVAEPTPARRELMFGIKEREQSNSKKKIFKIEEKVFFFNFQYFGNSNPATAAIPSSPPATSTSRGLPSRKRLIASSPCVNASSRAATAL